MGPGEELEDQEDEEDEPLVRTLFFAEGPDADERVCAAVWTMFVKSSNAHGFDARSSAVRKNSARIARLRAEGKHVAFDGYVPANAGREPTMTTEDQALAAYRELTKKHGRPPTNPELAESLGLKGPTETARIQAAWKLRKALVEKGLAEPSARGGARPEKKSTAKPAFVKEPPAPVGHRTRAVAAPAPTTPSRRASKDPIVASLIEKRDALLTKAKALDVAIEALSEAL